MLLPADPKAGYLSHKNELDDAIREVLESGWYILGEKVASFERNFSKYLNVASCIGVASGTDALNLALRASGVQYGDKVITVSHTAVATVSAIDWIGAIPILADIDPQTFTINPQEVEKILEKNNGASIKAIVAVHLYGHPADMYSLSEISEQYGVALIEDCAQAHGAMINGLKVGSFGTCGSFSFYPTKNLGAFGDGGAIVTNQQDILSQLCLLKQYGWRKRYISDSNGYNSRLDELQAAVLDCKLKWLDLDNKRRRDIASYYTKEFSDLPIETPIEIPNYHHVYHQYVVKVKKRDQLHQYLKMHGIGTAILYPVPVHLQPGYSKRVEIIDDGLLVTPRIANEILCLPIHPGLSDSDISNVVNSIKSFFG